MNNEQVNNEQMNQAVQQARAALDQARADHARALLDSEYDPTDPRAKQQMQQAVQQGRAAWREYQQAATAGLAAQIETIIPSSFRE